MKALKTLSAALVLCFAATSAWAQSSGGLLVRVSDAKDRSPLPGVQVTLTSDIQAIAPTTLVTDARGEAHFPILPARGIYSVDVYSPGYQRTRWPSHRVKPGESFVLPLQLSGEQEEVVKVEAARPVVELENTKGSTTFSGEFLEDLPVAGRFYQNMLTFAAGVQDADGDGNPNVHGARDRDFKAVVSGVSNQDPLTGQTLGLVSMDSIEEIEVITSGAGAEYSRAQGGFANIIQKQGSNDFEGVASFIYRSDKFDGNGALNVPTSLLPSFNWFQPALQVSGPVFKDKLWYRLTHEYVKLDLPVGILSGVAVSTIKKQIHDDQLTWQVSPRNKLIFQYRFEPFNQTNAGVSSVIPADSTPTVDSGGPVYSMAWTAPYSPKLLFESRVAYQNYELKLTPSGENARNVCVRGLPFLEVAYCLHDRTGNFSGSFPQTWADVRQRLTVRSDGTFYAGRFWGMTHTLKFGFAAENERYHRTLSERPSLFFVIVDTLTDPSGGGTPELEQIGIAFTQFSLPATSTLRTTSTNWGFYGEDEIKPRSNLTLKLGARVEKEYINSNGFIPFDPEAESRFFFDNRPVDGVPAFIQQVFTGLEGVQGQGGILDQFRQLFGFDVQLSGPAAQSQFWSHERRPGNINLDNTNFAPRLAVSWDPWTDGKTAIRFTAGRYYDKIFLLVPGVEVEPLRFNVSFDARQQGADWVVDPGADPVNPASNTQMVDRNLKTPHTDEFTFSIERELPVPETSITLRYIRRNFNDQLQDIDLNHVPADFGRCVLQGDRADPYILPSVGTGHTIEDVFTGETYIDNDPGIGDGRLDDCTGRIEPIEGAIDELTGLEAVVQRSDGILDLYAQNPGWGSILLVGNFNTAKYTGYELLLSRRQYKNWQLEGSYTYSKALGDAEDFSLLLGNDRSTLEDERGFLSYDVRHSLKVNATTQTPWGFRLGGAMVWQSGLPYSILRRDFSVNTLPPDYASLGSQDESLRTRYVTGRRNDQRNQSYWNVDVRLAKELSLPGGKNLQLTAEVFNLLNDGTVIIYNPFLAYGRRINGRNDATQRFGRQFQFGVRLAF